MNDRATARKPLAVIERPLGERDFVTIFGESYLIRHREDLGFGDLAKLDQIIIQYGHIMTQATGGKLERLTNEECDSLTEPCREMIRIFLEGIPEDVVMDLSDRALVTLMVAFTTALGNKPEPPTPMNRETKRRASRSPGTKSSPASSASTAATRASGRSREASRSG